MKIRDLRETGLPPHLRRHLDKDGNKIDGEWKGGKWRPKKKKSKWKDVTPKGYGPDESVNESVHNFTADDINDLARIRDVNSARRAALDLISTKSSRPMKPEKVKWFERTLQSKRSVMDIVKLMYDLLLAGEGGAVIGSRHSTKQNSYRQVFGEGEYEDQINDDPIHASYLVSMQAFNNDDNKLEDTKYIRVDFRVPSGGVAHPRALRRQIDTHPKIVELHKAGYINQKVIASWKSDPKAELADVMAKLAQPDLLQSYRRDYQKKAKELETAIEIMSSNEILENSIDTSLDEDSTKQRMPTHEIMRRIEQALPHLEPYGVREEVLGIISDILYKADQGVLEGEDDIVHVAKSKKARAHLNKALGPTSIKQKPSSNGRR